MMRVFIRPYHAASRAVKAIKEELKIRSLKIDGTSKYSPKNGDIIINYGNSQSFNYYPATVLNTPDVVELCADKMEFYRNHRNRYIPQTLCERAGIEDVHKRVFKERVGKDDVPVIVRTLTRASQGRGTYYFDSVNNLPKNYKIDGKKIKIISEYIKKNREFRVHMFGGVVFDIVEKKKMKDWDREDVNFKIRNHKNGWVFCRNDLNEVPHAVFQACEHIFSESGLDFGALDVIYNEYHNRAYVVEINTAPGMEGQTAIKYAEKFKEFINEKA